ncbi:SDR family NAD(P)-dependent oxidoreductase [Celeribacter indicus]|uniref:7-alpha-hydroxysteroid dehydrogenase n=1 Tax=Celeribacter indicus TaxID=1208324 RepID=A0A0B5E784_9RHOB|nr:SDR family oxidoreductase [Celeribacter indicus]AJE48911.1 7-alpha-hydroxysteroid dehydrogenase [Celeribacter indicus]SDW40917.1 7-alpha-hydroxysteroid dehydrogenase [Celeribacter indicus]
MSFSITGKTAIVTGAANGVGLAIARHFEAQGANVMCADIDEAGLVAQYGDAAEAEDRTVAYFAGDLREKLTIANLLSATIDNFDGVDILVNASRQVAMSDPLNVEEDNVAQLLDQNLMTSLRLTQQVAKWMIKRAEKVEGEEEGVLGSIVNLSSIAARRCQPELLAFSISSAAVDQMTRSMAVALAPHRIRVNAVAFGSVMSASLRDLLNENPDLRENIVAKTPLGRVAPAADIAETVQYLVSDCSGFMTGQILTVDGGRTLVDPVHVPSH